jgi:hypothetical protein
MLEAYHGNWYRLKKWTLKNAIRLFAEYDVFSRGVYDPEEFDRQLGDTVRLYSKWVTWDVHNNKLMLDVCVDDPECILWEGSMPCGVDVDFNRSYVDAESFLKWAKSKGISAPEPPESCEQILGSDSNHGLNVEFCSNDGPLTSGERRKYGLLKLQKDTMDKTIEAAVCAAIYYAKLKEGDIFDKDLLYNKLTECGYGNITDASIDIIYKTLPPDHKRKPGEKKTASKTQ